MREAISYCSILVLGFVLAACENGGPTAANGFGPNGLPAPTLPSTSSSSTPAPAGVVEDEPTGLAACGFELKRSGVKDDGGSFYVPVSGQNVGDVIVYVWIEKVNDGTKYGPYNPNEWFHLNLAPGSYKYQLAVELDIDGDGKADRDCQDDRHSGEFSIEGEEPRTPNTPDPIDVCPNLEGDQAEVPQGYEIVDGQCVLKCEPEWTEGDPERIGATEWSECDPDRLSRSRTVTYHVVSTNQCNDDTQVRDFEEVETEDCELPPEPEHGQCLYEVAGKKDEKAGKCTDAGGVFSEHDGSDHCVFDFPGISHKDFNLNGGLSDKDCLKKK